MADFSVDSTEHPPSARGVGGSRWPQVVKLVVTIGILALLLGSVDLGELGEAIRGSLGGWFWLALTSNALLLITSTWKWDRLLRAVGVVRDFGALLRLYVIGFFFSSFLPGTVGGDAVRWYTTSSTSALRLKVAATILAERVAGVVALMLLCVLAIAWDRERLATAPILILVAALSAALAGGLWLAASARLRDLLFVGSRGRVRRILRPVHKLHAVLTGVPVRTLAASVGYSVPFYASAGLTFYLVVRAFGADISFVEAATVQLLVCLLTLIPMSLGGLGLAQAGDVYLLGLLGVDAPTALGISFLRQAINYAYAALGALLFAGWSGHPSVSELRAVSEVSTVGGAPADAAGR